MHALTDEILGKLAYGGHREWYIYNITRELLGARVNGALMQSLIHAWNKANCIPPLDDERVNGIMGAVRDAWIRRPAGSGEHRPNDSRLSE